MACHMRMFRTLPVWPSVEAGESLKSRLRCQMCVLGAPNWVRFGFVFAHCKMRLPLFSMTSSLRSRYFAFLLWISRHPDDKAAYRRISRKAGCCRPRESGRPLLVRNTMDSRMRGNDEFGRDFQESAPSPALGPAATSRLSVPSTSSLPGSPNSPRGYASTVA
jgi:hypothetical protein